MALLSAEDRLGNIVAEEELRPHPTYGNPTPVVCFSESDLLGVEALLSHYHFEGWGIVVDRSWAWAAGGGPVWYARSEVWERLRRRVDPEALAFMVRTSAGDADWLHEREWRVPCLDGPLPLADVDVVALLVSDADWEPRPVPDVEINPQTGLLAWADVTPRIACSVPRWLWDGERVTVLPPLPYRYEFWPVQP